MAVLRTVLRRAAAPRALMAAAARPFSAGTSFAAKVSNAPPIDPPSRADIGVGELEGHEFKIEPLRRVGEDEKTMRARLVYQSRKRGTLESDLLLSTFADTYLPDMSREQMAQYDLFLDENDWDIYYWATQEAPSPATEDQQQQQSSSPASTSDATPTQTGQKQKWTATSPFQPAVNDLTAAPGQAGKNAAAAAAAASEEPYRKPGEGEWAQTVGTFKPAYRPVPQRWRDSEVLALLREHVGRRSLGGREGGGMGFMPSLKNQG
ncbi:Flavinator of succinate dehydrogenase-domain-containing protein [Truncatella angustata]|uniref:Succinate dehydrogenase assembly factor 2, mitochondrial n=1 Tax=Truncatella angustata TaxID=152316 RepID=A0A9P8UID6_9PEZI|nr:Flavinator of succinate dehydrogenase-domain-containing protein [Truncatella angustata]KAH6652686.1 Flavinator of succinate dehydrogenase-domain-containing protein [Truncatella angustata]